MKTISLREILAKVPAAIHLNVPEEWFRSIRPGVHVFDAFYRWISERCDEDVQGLHSRTYVSPKLHRRLLKLEEQRIAQKYRYSGGEIERALKFSDVNAGPMTLVAQRTLKDVDLVVVPEQSEQAFRQLCNQLEDTDSEVANHDVRTRAWGKNFTDWLRANNERTDLVGDLARDCERDSDFPDSTFYFHYHRYLERFRPAVLEALAEAWLEYSHRFGARLQPSAWCTQCASQISDFDKGLLTFDQDGEFRIRHLHCRTDDELKSVCLSDCRSDQWQAAFATVLKEMEVPAEVLANTQRLLQLCGIARLEVKVSQWVYFIQQLSTGFIKIGKAKDVEKRRISLQTGSAEILVVLAKIEGSSTLEKQLHARFGAHRANGEWFRPAPELLAYITMLETNDPKKAQPPAL